MTLSVAHAAKPAPLRTGLVSSASVGARSSSLLMHRGVVTYEIANGFELFLPGYNSNYRAEISLMHYKDIKVHRGDYFELQTKVKLFDFKTPLSSARLEPNLVYTTGLGNSRHNNYAYGAGGEAGDLTYHSLGIWVAIPEVVDRFYPNLQLTYFETASSQRNGVFAKDRNHGILFSFIASFSVLDWWKKP